MYQRKTPISPTTNHPPADYHTMPRPFSCTNAIPPYTAHPHTPYLQPRHQGSRPCWRTSSSPLAEPHGEASARVRCFVTTSIDRKDDWVYTQLPLRSRISKVFDSMAGYIILTTSSGESFIVKGAQVKRLISALKIDENLPLNRNRFEGSL